MIDFDLMLVHVGEFGLYQKILFLFQAPFCIFVTFVLFGQLFIYIYPRQFWCQESPCLYLNHSITNMTRDQRRNISIPYHFGNRSFDPCNTFDVTAKDIQNLVETAKERCRAIPKCRNNQSQICDYSVLRDECKPRTFVLLSRKKRQSAGYGNRNGWWQGGHSQDEPGGEDLATTSATRGGVNRPNTDWSGNVNDNNWRGSNYGRVTTFAPPGPGPSYTGRSQTTAHPNPNSPAGWGGGGSGRDQNGVRGVPSQPTSTRRTVWGPAGPGASRDLNPVCEDIRVNRFTIYRQDNFTSEIGYTSSKRGQAQTNLNVTVTRIIIEMPNNTFIDVENLTNSNYQGRNWTTVPCQSWTYHQADFAYPTIVTELNWWCGAERWITTANAIFYLGAIVGGIGIGYIADMGGRVPALVTANLLGCVGGALSAIFYQNFYLFCFFRFIAGMAFDNSFTMIYILVLEYVGPTYRTLVANLSIAVFYTIGTLILPWLALAIGNWRIYMLVISLPMSLAIIGIFVVPESARWLLSKGRTKEATRILRSFAKVNGRNVPEKIFIEFEADANELYKEISKEKDATLMEAFKKPRIAKNFIFLTLIWAMIALVYDGHSRNVLNLGDNIFISFTIASSTEFPADMLLIFTLDRFGRRWLAFGSLCMSGGFSLAAALVPAGMATMSLVMALMARFCVNVAFNIGLQYAAELLPTVIRAQGVNIIHIMGYVASIIAPFIASIGRTNPALSLVILGTIAITGGVLCLFLPETLGEDLPNTLEDGEVFGKNQSFWNCPICSKPRPPDEDKLEPTPVQLRHNMRASLRGEGFRSSMISSKRMTPIDTMMMNPMATETTRLKRGYTK